MLAAEGLGFTGQRDAAVRRANEVLKLFAGDANNRLMMVMACRVLAWNGAEEAAVELLEQAVAGAPAMPPSTVARDRLFSVPLAKNARYRALTARLEQTMRATKLQ